MESWLPRNSIRGANSISCYIYCLKYWQTGTRLPRSFIRHPTRRTRILSDLRFAIRLLGMRSAEAIIVDALALPTDERAALVLRLAESLDEQQDADAEDAWAGEVAARIERVQAGTAETTTTAEALAQARARLSTRRG